MIATIERPAALVGNVSDAEQDNIGVEVTVMNSNPDNLTDNAGSATASHQKASSTAFVTAMAAESQSKEPSAPRS